MTFTRDNRNETVAKMPASSQLSSVETWICVCRKRTASNFFYSVCVTRPPALLPQALGLVVNSISVDHSSSELDWTFGKQSRLLTIFRSKIMYRDQYALVYCYFE
jgi:hypothetical protein